ncbi:MAG TPA: hypothetical protein VI007_06220 [bacterium]
MTARLLGGVKVYSLDWHLRYGLDYAGAADLLASQGMDLVIAQNRYLPMADSAVRSAPSDVPQSYDDRQFVEALRARGMQYYAACNLFFDPETLARHPDALAVDASGRVAQPVDWYIATCPTHEDYFADKLQQLETAVRELRSDGVFLGFTRFPGFWEQWLPQTSRGDWSEYCFCPRCVRLFGASTGVRVPEGPGELPGSWIRAHAYAGYVEWKTDVITARLREIKNALRRIHPPVRIMLNTLPLGPADFGGAGREVFGQDWAKLREVVDLFEVMAYHQILGREVSWINRITREVKTAVDRPVLVTVQAKPFYLEGMHAGRGRSPVIPVEEFARALDAARDGGADGIVVFTWSDLLRQVLAEQDTRFVNAVRRVTRG